MLKGEGQDKLKEGGERQARENRESRKTNCIYIFIK